MNRLAYALLCSAFLASAMAGNAETNASPLDISAEGLAFRVPVPVAEAVSASRTPVVSLNGFGRLSNDASLRASDGGNGEPRRKTGIMLEIIGYLVATVLMTFALLFIRKRLLWRYTRFDDFNWNGSTEQPRMPGSKTEIWVESLPREEQEDGAAQPGINLECSKDEVLMLNGCLTEIGELFWYESRNATANRFDFEDEIGLPLTETESLATRIGRAYNAGKRYAASWRFRFRREELVAILNSIRMLTSPRSSLLCELETRTGFSPSEFMAFAERIRSSLTSITVPKT